MAETLVVNSVSLQDQDFMDTATKFLDGGLLNRYAATILVTYSKKRLGARLKFDSATKTITNINGLDNTSFLTDDKWRIGDHIIVPASANNHGVLTLTGIADNVLNVAESLTTETLEVGNIYLHDKITALDLFYNLIGNNESESYESKTDTGTLQRYYATGLDTTVATPVGMFIGSKSRAWVTDTLTGNVSQATIVGTNSGFGTGSNYDQTFTITQYFFQTPYILPGLFPNFQTDTPPPQYVGMGSTPGTINGVRYICNVGARLSAGSPILASGSWIQPDGIAAWVDQNNARTQPDFTIGSISYVDDVTGNTLSAGDFSKIVDVTIVLRSAAAAFVNNTTKVIVNHAYAPLAGSDYIGTSSTLRQNYMHDRAVLVCGSAPSGVNGEFYGSNYSVIQNAKATYNSTSQITVTFKMVYATYLKNFLIARPGNRNYGIFCVTE